MRLQRIYLSEFRTMAQPVCQTYPCYVPDMSNHLSVDVCDKSVGCYSGEIIYTDYSKV
jgi:hypothetical protein